MCTKIIETQIWEAMPGNPNKLTLTGQRKAKEVFEELFEALKKEDILPDEYFLLSQQFDNETVEIPVIEDICCFAEWGVSEGIYLYANLFTRRPDVGLQKVHFATGKTLKGDSDSFDRMQYIAGYIYKLFTGYHETPARYMLVDNKELDIRTELFARVQEEYHRYLRKNLVHKQIMSEKFAKQIGLRSLIVAELPKCLLPEDKAEELKALDNVLDFLTRICSSILEANAFEINDIISSCRSFRQYMQEEQRSGKNQTHL